MRRYQNWIVFGVVALLIVAELIVVRLILRPNGYDQRKDYIQIVATLAAGTILLGQFIVAGLNLAATDRNIELSRTIAMQKADSDREGQITERFTRAVDQLGSETLAIRLGGIFALERIAWDSARDHITIIELLVAYMQDRGYEASKDQIEIDSLRMRLQDPKLSVERREDLEEEERSLLDVRWSAHQDLRSIIEVIGRRNLEYEKIYAPGLNFSGIPLDGLIFSNHFERAGFFGSTLRQVSFHFTRLDGANFNNVRMESGVYFIGVSLNGADFTGALIENTVFFHDTDLSNTIGLTQWHIDRCSFSGKVTLPYGLHWPGRSSEPPGIVVAREDAEDHGSAAPT
jgi:hypothetical protein